MIGWFRVPLDAAKTLTGDHKATRMEATVDLLGRWHLGGNPGVRELMRAWDWSGDRVTKFVAEMRLWAAENGAYLPAPNARPNKIGQQPDSNRTPSGQPDADSMPEVEEQPDSDRTVTGQAPDASCARGKEEEEETVDGRRDPEIPAATATGAPAITGGLFAHLTQPDPQPTTEPKPTPEPTPPKKARAPKGATAGASQAKERTWGYQEAIDAWDHAFAEVMETAYPWVWTGQYANGKHVKTWLAAARIKCEADVPDGIGRIYGAALAYLRAVKAGAAWPREEKPNVPRFAKDIAQWLQTDPDATPRANGKIDPNQATRDALARALQQMEGVAN